MAGSDRGSWLDPLNRMIWQRAFIKRAKTCTLRDGTVFKLTYMDKYPGEVWVSPASGGYVPCGWFVLERVVTRAWVREGIADSADDFLKWLKQGESTKRIHRGVKFTSNVDSYSDEGLQAVIELWEDERIGIEVPA